MTSWVVEGEGEGPRRWERVEDQVLVREVVVLSCMLPRLLSSS